MAHERCFTLAGLWPPGAAVATAAARSLHAAVAAMLDDAAAGGWPKCANGWA